MKKRLSGFVKNKSHVKITIKWWYNRYWFIVNYWKLWIILQIIEDFHIDWYMFIPYTVIIWIYYTKQEKYFETIMIQEWIIDKININYKYSELENYNNLFEKLKSKIISVELYNNNFMCGRIIDIYDKRLLINCFSSFWKFDMRNKKINFDKILYISYDNEYLNVFSKYL